MKKYSVIFICFNANVQGRSVIITFIAFLPPVYQCLSAFSLINKQ